ncbi:beta-propeller domain-containing protein [Myxococcus sp. AM009]|uniref:beta-propeller domain-containing protein n=1 Tax=Myxococcus sp. AM009 TaxID=2745137 RepID=UPI001C3E1DEF|nr:beta-propeller domain-containing protein [Myxococcus sp. AM009]
MQQWKRWSWAGVVAVVAVGCGDEGSKPPPPFGNEPVRQEARLETFPGCEALEQHIEDTATKQMRAVLEVYKQYTYGGGRGGEAPPTPTVGAPQEDSAGGGGSPTDYTGTNNQVSGVHEADFVQNDGTRIFVLSGQRLYLHRSWPAEQLARTAALEVEGWPREMLLDPERNRLVITSAVSEPRPGSGSGGRVTDGPALDCAGFGCGGYGHGNTVKVTVVDVADLEAPRVLEQVYLPGGYLSARRVEGAVRLVVSDGFRWPADVRLYPEYSRGLFDNRLRLAAHIDALIQQNEQAIRAQTLAQWLPPGRRVTAAGEVKPLAYDCTSFYRTNAPTGLGLVSVLSLNLDASESEPGRTSLVAAPGEVYASHDALYLAARHWWWWPEPGQTTHTYLHKFDIRDPDRATYVGSGTVEGYVVNQFAMDEHEGVLRVATTVELPGEEVAGDGDAVWTPPETVNRVVTLREEGGYLKQLGRSEDLARGERIFSARFVGTRGYVVTFRQVDPLFTFDLSDPAHPRMVGELKIPGFSTYIHPLGDTHLLTFGEHRNEDGTWQDRALKLSLFDVSDLARPRETFTHQLGSMSSHSEALQEHKAFTYFPAKGLLALPFMDWDYNAFDYWSAFRSELRVFRVDTATGFSPVGTVSVRDMYQAFNFPHWSWYWQPTVRRSIMADDYVYAISDAGLRVSHVSSLQTPLATAPFLPPAPAQPGPQGP